MTETQRPRQVVVAFDFSPSSTCALELALDTVVREPGHVLHVLAAIDPAEGLPILRESPIDLAYVDEIQRRMHARVTELLAGRDAGHEVHFFLHARLGPPADEILQLADEVGADLVLIGSHGRTGLERLMMGSVSERVVREARCPVLVARERTYADAALLRVVDAEHPHHRYARPHRYAYVDNRVQTRPPDWPLF